MKGNSFNYKKLLVAFVVLILVSQTSLWLVKLPTDNDQIKPLVERIIPQKPVHNEKPDLNLGSDNFYYEPAWDIIRYLGDNPNEYSLIWEPWLTKAAVHAITATPDYDMFAFGGGYLYDNEIHIYRWNSLTRNYEKVWCSGDGIIDGDILSLAIGDTDNNNFLEIVAGSADGHIYVFEQRHIYDPFTNIENQFELVWTSPFLGPVWKVAIGDLDKDYIKEIIAVSWDKKIHIYEYDEHSGYPFSHEHWISYKEVWNSGSVIDDLILSMGFGDINYNGLPEILVGTRSGKLYLFENNGTVIYINDYPFPLTKDNDYKLIWRTSQFWDPIFNIRVGNTDNTPGDEGVIVIPGYGTLILDYDENNGEFYFTELIIPLESWELGTGEEYEFPLDYYIDSMVNASNVYYVESDVIYEEPITYTYDKDTKTWNPDLAIAIKNTAMAGEPDDYYSHVNSTDTEPAWAILDFGRDEEILGSGTSTSDFAIRILNKPGFTFPVNLANFEISISQDGELFIPVDSSDISRTYTSTVCYVYVNIDNVISSYHWRHVRYIKINVTNGDKYAIDSIRACRLNKPVSTALSVTLDNFHTNITKILSGEDSIDTMKSIILGTVDGRIYVFRYNETTYNYEMIYDSYMKDNITLGENIWDIYKIGKTSNFPVFYAEPYKGAKLTLPGNNETNMHTFFDLGGTYPHLIVGTKNSMILAFTNNNFETYTYDESKTVSLFDKVNARYLGIDSSLSLTVKFVDLDTSNSYYELVVGYLKEGAVGSVNPLDDDYTTPTAGLELWTVVESGYSTYIDLTTRDGSGRMQAIVLSGEIPPTVDFYDYDSDGDMDMVLSNGRLFLFKNVGSSTYAKFQLIEGYFDDINSRTKGKLLEHPIIVDFDRDGDFDIIVSYYNRSGATYFENEGTLSNPKWVEKRAMFSNSIRETKPVTNFGYNNFTNVVFTELQDESLRTILGSDFLMTAYNPFAGNITVFYPDFNHQSRYLIATYPLVYTLDLALMNSKKYKNYGYHLLDTWDTYRELRGWTLTLEHADLDKDGKGEVIIGDFDNNIYVFEHLVNNTYKRAYRSPDITHNETTDISPYAWEELEGISGNFTRIVWDHVTEIVVDVDTDKDGYEEFIAVADFSIYIFEATDVDDTYTLIWYYNLRETAWNSTFETYDIEGITALAYTYDINKNYRRDFAVAAGNVLFIFEYDGSGFVEIYAGDPPNGQFSLPGNPAYYPDLYINTIAYGLLDDDNYYDLVLGGINTTASCLGIHGFVVVLEFTSSSISMIWQGPADYYKNNPVNIIRVDNQDYDDTQEIIVGHSKGIDIWEYDSKNNDFKISETITSDPNHPLIELQNVLSSENIFIYKRSLDMVHLDNETILAIFGRNTAYGERLYYTKSYDNGTTWTTPSQLVADTDYGSFTVSNEYYPSVTQLKNGEIWVTWYAEYTYLSTDYKGIFAYRWDGNAWTLYTVYYKLASTAEYDGPAVFEIDSTGDMPVGIAFHLISLSTGKGSIYIRGYNTTTSSWQTLGTTETIGRNQEYEINSLDMIRITPGNYLLAFSGYWRNESKIDYDIWVSSVNSTFGFSRPVRVTHSFYHESHPDMALLPTTPNATILIVYESSNGPFGHSIHASYSRDFGLTWSREYYLPSIHPMVKVSCADTYVSYKVYARAGWQQVARIITFEPTVAPFLYGGFIYGFNTKVLYFFPQPNTYTIYGIAFGAKPSSSWALYDIGDVWTFAVGDSDRDNRREIVANYYDYSVTLFELFNSNETYMYHSQIWYSPKSPTKITDISIGDSNGNGWPEIVVSSDCGNVYAYEMIYQTYGQGKLSAIFEDWYTKLPESTDTAQVSTGDVNGDGEKDIIVLTYSDILYAYDSTGHLIFSINVTKKAGSSLYPVSMKVADINKDSIDEILIGFRDGIFACFKQTNLAYADKFYATTVYDIKVMNQFGSTSEKSFIALRYLQHLVVLEPVSGDKLYAIETDSSIVLFEVGDVTGDGFDDVLIIETSGNHTVINGLDGTKVWSMVLSPQIGKAALYDLTDDGFADVITVNGSDIVAIDGLTRELLWNTTLQYSGTPYIYVMDIDNEAPYDVVVAYRNGYDLLGLDGKDGIIKWHTRIQYSIEHVYEAIFYGLEYKAQGILLTIKEPTKTYVLGYDNYGLLLFGIAIDDTTTCHATADILDLDRTSVVFGFKDGFIYKADLDRKIVRGTGLSISTVHSSSQSITRFLNYHSTNDFVSSAITVILFRLEKFF